MPEIRYYTVTQEREVRVSAPSAIEAANIASAVFDGKTSNDIPAIQDGSGSVTKPVRIRDLVIREEF